VVDTTGKNWWESWNYMKYSKGACFVTKSCFVRETTQTGSTKMQRTTLCPEARLVTSDRILLIGVWQVNGDVTTATTPGHHKQTSGQRGQFACSPSAGQQCCERKPFSSKQLQPTRFCYPRTERVRARGWCRHRGYLACNSMPLEPVLGPG
jgi:hypothetical protein